MASDLGVTFNDVIDEILETVTPLKRVNTQANHKIYLSEIRSELGSVLLSDFTRREYIKWITIFKPKKQKRHTFDCYTKFLNIIFMYAYKNNLVSFKRSFPKTDPAREITGRVYTDPELIRLYGSAKMPMLLQFVLAFECFMRLREVLHLTWDRVSFDKRQITLRKEDVKTGTKLGRGRFVPLSDYAIELLIDHKKNSTSPYVFPCPKGNGYVDSNKKAWSILKAHAKITGRARWHDIRHTALTKASIEKKVSPLLLCQVAGLSIRTLERVYLHKQVEHLREVTQSLKIKEICEKDVAKS